MNIAKNLNSIRIKLGLTESEMARLSGLNQPTIHRMLSGETSDPGASKLFALKKGLKVSYEQIIEGKGLDTIKEESVTYITKKENPRTQRICDFIKEWLEKSSSDKQAWFEEDFKIKNPEYKRWLKTKELS